MTTEQLLDDLFIDALNRVKDHVRALRDRVEYSDLADRFSRLPESHLYIARVSGAGSPVKIGRSINVMGRLRSMQTAQPMELIATVPEWVVSEKEAHVHFAAARQYGEWFVFSGEMAQWIAELPARWDALTPLCRRIRTALRLKDDGTQMEVRRPLRAIVRAEVQVMHRIERQEREAAIRRAEKERQQRAEALRVERGRRVAVGCRLCLRAPVTVYRLSEQRPTWVCSSCLMWYRKFQGDPESAQCAADDAAAKHRRLADEIEQRTALRIMNLAAEDVSA